MASCWLTAPADAAVPATVGEAPAAAASVVSGQVAAPTAPVAAAGAALNATATEASGSVERVVTGAADTGAGAGHGAQPAVDALPPVTAVSPPPAESPRAAAPRRGPGLAARASRSGAPRRITFRKRHADARRRSDAPSVEARFDAAQTGFAAATEANRAAKDLTPPTGSIQAAPERAPLLDPASGAAVGSSASGASASLLFGGLAVLLTAVCLAGPALRRRLSSRQAMSWPAAFVPLLERPG